MTITYRWTDEPSARGLTPGAVVLSSFPSAGYAATVAAHYVLRALNLPRIGSLESPDSPPIAVIQNGEVQPPIRVYGRPDLAVIVSEFPPILSSTGAIAQAILDGAESHQARAVICLEGVVPHPADEETDGEENQAEETIWGVTARKDSAFRASLERAKVRFLEDGVIGGVTGAMLVAGLHSPIPVSTLLVSARDTAGYPDHRAGAAIIETLDRLLPELKIDTGPLRSQAEMIERVLRAAMKSRTPVPGPEKAVEGPATMYQ
ncbi:MAG TPA: PAC2 family protein [Thermoplasmata archaeon]|nr:PAC2 family protein [Thermoplasmata archaeon]